MTDTLIMPAITGEPIQPTGEHAERIRSAWARIGVTRSTMYTPAERRLWHVAAERPTRGAIVLAGSDYYVRVADQFVGPFSRPAAEAVFAESLALVHHATPHPDVVGAAFASPIVVSRIESELAGDAARVDRYHELGPTLVLSPCPRRVIVPREHASVRRWLEAAFGREGAERIQDWMALAVDPIELDPIVALWLHGPRNLGKDMFAHGLARAFNYTRVPVDARLAAQRFNAAIESNPIVYANESPPRDYRGRVDLDWMRRFPFAHEHQIEPKGGEVRIVRGASRLVVGTNAAPSEYLKCSDREARTALGDRFLVIEGRDDGVGWLRAHADEARDIFDGLAIAEHATWLAQEAFEGRRKLPEGTRTEYLDGSGAAALGLDGLTDDEAAAVDALIDAIVTGSADERAPFVCVHSGGHVVGYSATWLRTTAGKAAAEAIARVRGDAKVRRPLDRVGTKWPTVPASVLLDHARRDGREDELEAAIVAASGVPVHRGVSELVEACIVAGEVRTTSAD